MKAAAKSHVSFCNAVEALRPVIVELLPPHAKPAALGPLQQNHAHKQQGKDQVDGKDNVFHGHALSADAPI